MSKRRAGHLGQQLRPGTPAARARGILSDEHLPAQNIPFRVATAYSPASAEFIHIGGSGAFMAVVSGRPA
jgi:hypothetical protein